MYRFYSDEATERVGCNPLSQSDDKVCEEKLDAEFDKVESVQLTEQEPLLQVPKPTAQKAHGADLSIKDACTAAMYFPTVDRKYGETRPRCRQALPTT